jgi:ketosteroid isomerase-like protein
MQHPNIDLVQGLYAAYMGGDGDRVRAAFAPDVRWHNSGYDALAGTLEGPAAVLDYLMGQDHMEDYRLEVVDMLASEARVAIVARSSGRVGGRQLTNDFVQVIRLEAGRVAEVWNYNWDQRTIAEVFPAA